jgi:hypothetical protein
MRSVPSVPTDADPGLAERVAAVVGRPVVALEKVTAGGVYSPSQRWIAQLADGSAVFVKAPADPRTAAWLGAERRAYETLLDAPYLPRYLGSDDGVLVLEDLRATHWPPPWREGDLDRVRGALEAVAATPAPTRLRSLEDGLLLRTWARVAEDPKLFLDLGMCTPAWLDRAMAVLVETDATPLVGEALVHSDLRSDNLCLLEDRVVLIDWPGAARGRPDFDLTSFAPSCALEQAIEPECVAPKADPSLVAVLAGCLAYHGPQPLLPPPVRVILLAHLEVLLPWAARLLDLPPPDGRVD